MAESEAQVLVEDDVLARVENVTGESRRDLMDGMNCTENRTFITWEKFVSGKACGSS